MLSTGLPRPAHKPHGEHLAILAIRIPRRWLGHAFRPCRVVASGGAGHAGRVAGAGAWRDHQRRPALSDPGYGRGDALWLAHGRGDRAGVFAGVQFLFHLHTIRHDVFRCNACVSQVKG